MLWIQQEYSASEGVTFKVPTLDLTRNKFILLGQDCTPDDKFYHYIKYCAFNHSSKSQSAHLYLHTLTFNIKVCLFSVVCKK